VSQKLRYINEVAIVFGCVAFGSQAAEAQQVAALPAASSPTVATGETRPVRAWIEYCERHAADCAVDVNEPSEIVLTPATWQKVLAVNARVNDLIQPLTDEDHWGVIDSWDLPTDGSGDCEDYQLLKRKLLVEAGFPRRALRMTVVLDEKSEGHAVLMVRTDRGDFILDNKVQSVLPWHQTGYIYVKREGHDGTAWNSLGGAMSPVATANR
jgi:predicted transglutaminase-like cysteine proteinase